MDNFDFVRILKFLPGIILGLTVHEYSHAFVADRCGDSTSKDQGRITLNPLKHIDPFGFIMLIVAGFGWAKPVQFNEGNLRNPHYDVMKIAVAGPLSNAVTAMVLSIIFSVFTAFIPVYQNSTLFFVAEIIRYSIYINWALFIFNLIPIPPLDGSHLLFNQFRKHPAVYDALYKYGSYLFIGLIILTVVSKINFLPIGPAIAFFHEGFLDLVGFNGYR